MAAEGDNTAPPRGDSLVAALRYSGDEVQLGRAIAVACRDPKAASSFCKAVLSVASPQSSIPSPPAALSCIPERVLLGRASRGRLRRHRKGLGRADLDFRGADDWRLIVELKLDSGLGVEQLERYSAEAPVAIILRDPTTIELPDMLEPWIGAVAWSDLLPAIRSLPLDPRMQQQWADLLDVVEMDGDFASRRELGPELLEAKAVLQQAAPEILDGFRKALQKFYGQAAGEVSEKLDLTAVRAGRSGWATVEISDGEEWWLQVRLRDIWSRSPRIRVYFNLAPSRRERRQLRGQLAALKGLGIEPTDEDFLFDDLVPGESDEQLSDRMVDHLTEKLGGVVSCGVYDLVFPDAPRNPSA